MADAASQPADSGSFLLIAASKRKVRCAHLLLQALHHGGHEGHPVLLDLLHLELQLLLGHAAEVAVLLHGPEQHVALVLPLLGQNLEDLRLLGLRGWRRWRRRVTGTRGGESASLAKPSFTQHRLLIFICSNFDSVLHQQQHTQPETLSHLKSVSLCCFIGPLELGNQSKQLLIG